MNIFLDCGFYSGVALKQYIDQGIVDETWQVYGFEANPEIMLNDMSRFLPVKVKLIKKAVWTTGGKVKFHIAGREDAAGVADLTGHTDPKEVMVPAMDFSKFVAELPEAYIICSMDIEGSEYGVLEKMLKEDTINKINLLDIEFHHRFMNDYDEHYSQSLIANILDRGVGVRLKVALR